MEYDEMHEEDSIKWKEKSSRKIWQDVFDERVLKSLHTLAHKGYLDKLSGVISSGKESNILYAEDRYGNPLAVKIYMIDRTNFRSMMDYIRGDPRFEVRNNLRQIVYTWTKKEYSNLLRAYKADISVPRPVYFYENILIMQFIGKDGMPAPNMHKTPPKDPKGAFEKVKGWMRRIYQEAGLVHGDLSEYNIVDLDGEYTIIDWSQSVVKEHSMAPELLDRDITNVSDYFSKLGVDVPSKDEMRDYIMKGGD